LVNDLGFTYPSKALGIFDKVFPKIASVIQVTRGQGYKIRDIYRVMIVFVLLGNKRAGSG